MHNKEYLDELVKAVKSGDQNAFRVIHELHYEKLTAFVNSFTKSRTNTEDILQETFIKIWNSREKLDSVGSITGYLYRTAHNSYIDKYRKETREKKVLDGWKYKCLMEAVEEDNEVTLKRINKLKSVIESLPKSCKQVFKLCKYVNLTHAQIADQLDISQKTVQAHMNKAYKVIREEFKDTGFMNLFLSFYK